jgi:hypothetical protein
MSNEGFRNVPGVPDGWELVKVGVPDSEDWLIGHDGNPVAHCMLKRPLKLAQYAIIRKIEQPAKYRPFFNSKEAETFFDCRLRFKDDRLPGLFRVIAINDSFVGIGVDTYAYPQAFDTYVCEDGTPFGVRIDE